MVLSERTELVSDDEPSSLVWLSFSTSLLVSSSRPSVALLDVLEFLLLAVISCYNLPRENVRRSLSGSGKFKVVVKDGITRLSFRKEIIISTRFRSSSSKGTLSIYSIYFYLADYFEFTLKVVFPTFFVFVTYKFFCVQGWVCF